MPTIESFEVVTILRNDDFVVRDHLVHAVRVMPGVTFLDMTFRAIATAFDCGRIELRNVLFREPVVTSQEFDREIVLSVTADASAGQGGPLAQVVARSRMTRDDRPLGAWEENFRCSIAARSAEAPEPLAVDELKARARAGEDLETAYELARSRRIEHGEFMKAGGRVYRGPDFVLARVDLSGLAARYDAHFYMHPVYLDASTLVPSLARTGNGPTASEPYIPFFIECVRPFRRLRGGCWVHVPLASLESAGDVISGDHRIYTVDGEPVAEFVKLTYKRVRNEGLLTNRAVRQAAVGAPIAKIAEIAQAAQAESTEAALLGLVKGYLPEADAELEASAGFYDMGLDSTQLLELSATLEKRLGSELYPTLLFEHNTIEKLARYLDERFPAGLTHHAVSIEVPAETKAERVPAQTVLAVPEWLPTALPEPRRAGTLWLLRDGDASEEQLRVALGEWALEVVSLEVTNDEFVAASAVAKHALPDAVIYPLPRSQGRDGGWSRLHAFVQAFLTAAGSSPLRFIVLAPEGAPEGVALEAYLKSLASEQPGIAASVVLHDGASAEHVARELGAEGVHLVRYAGGHRSVRGLREVDAPATNASLPRDGVFIVTGGAGGLGLITARWLAEKHGARAVVLSGRRAVDAELSQRIDAVRALGCDVDYVRADVAKREDVQTLCEDVRRRHGRIDGVFHSAGLVRDGLILHKSRSDIAEVLGPKVSGVTWLNELTAKDDLACFVVFSSTSAITGNVAQADYAYANAFTDAFAARCARQRKGRTLSVNWPLWRDGGMQVPAATLETLSRRYGIEPLETHEGIDALERALATGAPQVAVFHGARARLTEGIGILPPAAALAVKDAETGAPPPRAVEDRIAVIGISGRYPEADDVEALWERLAAGKDCISSRSASEWQRARVPTSDGAHYWGGFVRDADCFDPKFFRISPREAEFMDPQERLFLQCAWSVVEDAGYRVSELAKGPVGVFVGVMWSQYQLLGARDGVPLGASFSAVANRVSYTFGLTGPSLAVDSMCSSSMTALHLACEALRRGECDVAIAGGVNVTASISKYVQLEGAHMLASDGRCKSFASGGDGYVPSEGVGSVLLKPLAHALRDGDHVYGVIRGSALNHGGKTAGFSIPDPAAQGSVIAQALARAEVSPAEISYVEAHGTGTALGDPIEVDGLIKGFGGVPREAPCALGSIKSNIGHAESAAGVAALTKVLLQFERGALVPSIHSESLNPAIQFERAGLRVQRALEPWDSSRPRIAGISSFGAGGSNSHVIVEEPPARAARPSTAPSEHLFPLSAQSAEQLRKYAADLAAEFRTRATDLRADDVAFTLQRGREPMRERVCVLASKLADAADRFAAFARSETADGVWAGRVATKSSGAAPASSPPDLRAIAQAWVAGASIEWAHVEALTGAARMALSTYPFARERYWYQASAIVESTKAIPDAAPVHVADRDSVVIWATLDPKDATIRDHSVFGTHIAPGALVLQWFWEALGQSYPVGIDHVLWQRALVTESQRVVHVCRRRVDGANELWVTSADGREQFARARLADSSSEHMAGGIDVTTVLERCPRSVEGEDLYAFAAEQGFDYGPSFRLLARGHVGERDALAEIALRPGESLEHWQAIEAAFQSAFLLGRAEDTNTRYVPFSIDSVQWRKAIGGSKWVVCREVGRGEGGAPRFDMTLLDAHGEVCAEVVGFAMRAAPGLARGTALRTYTPDFAPAALAATAGHAPPALLWVVAADEKVARDFGAPRLAAGDFQRSAPPSHVRWVRASDVKDGDEGRLIELMEREGAPSHVLLVAPSIAASENDVDAIFRAAAHPMAVLTRALVRARIERVRGLVVHPAVADDACDWHAALPALARSIAQESPGITWRCASYDAAASDAKTWTDELLLGQHVEVRWRGARREARIWSPLDASAFGPMTRHKFRNQGVYLVTGGLGGIGKLVARHLARTCHAKLVLVGRSNPGPDAERTMEQLRALGASVRYIAADIGTKRGAFGVVRSVTEAFGHVDGVFHCAGVLRDALLVNKRPEDWHDVLSAKVQGALWLDEALREQSLDCFVLFGSLAGVFGNAGQCDYAWANAALSAFARARQERVDRGEQFGRTVSIDWPLWSEGGMRLDAAGQSALFDRMGLTPLATTAAMQGLEQSVGAGVPEIAICTGEETRLDRAFESLAIAGDAESDAPAVEASGDVPDARVTQALEQHIAGLIAAENKLTAAEIDPLEPLEVYGVDSVVVMNVTRALEAGLGPLPKTLFYQYQTVSELAAYFTRAHAERARAWLGVGEVRTPPPPPSVASIPAPPVVPEVASPSGRAASSPPVSTTNALVAVIGISGRYPLSNTLDAFWDNLAAGRDCITEVPRERWDFREHFSTERDKAGSSYTKWGGFISDVDKFDPLFFRIAPREAAFMDPQERLFLETVWEAMEDAGYSRKSLQKRAAGVFAGVMWGQYQLFRANVGDGVVSPSSIYASVANRVSYCLDLRGPSMTVDTMCSSSLTALHLAVESIRRGECEVAFAGGVNLSLHPNKYETLSFLKFASSEGRCRAFGEGGDGYVPGEGVGAVMLKRLDQALADGDRVYGVIRGISLNHGGKTTAYAVPNPDAQAQVIAAALETAGVHPDEVSYVEAHGTGTALGDPIEIAGLTQAYQRSTRRTQYCAIGSVKSNIGHLEAAAGVASLTKVLLQFGREKMLPSINAERLNPHIQFEETPFVVQRELRDWPRQATPRIAAISSFGAGGSNAHVLVQEPPEGRSRTPALRGPHAVLLSAKSADRLEAYARKLLDHVRAAAPSAGDRVSSAPAADDLRTWVAEWLGVGAADVTMEASIEELALDTVGLARLEARIADVYGRDLAIGGRDRRTTLRELARALGDGDAPASAQGIDLAALAYTSQVGRDAFEERLAIVIDSAADLTAALESFLRGESRPHVHRGSATKAAAPSRAQGIEEHARVWALGAEVDWPSLWQGAHPRRAAFPTYPFARERCWIREVRETNGPTNSPNGSGGVKPSSLRLSLQSDLAFEGVLEASHWLTAQHTIQGVGALPAAGILELVFAAAGQVWGGAPAELTSLIIERPIWVRGDTSVSVVLRRADGDAVRFEVAAAGGPAASHGTVARGAPQPPRTLDFDAMEKQLPQIIEPEVLYGRLAQSGIEHGPSFRLLRSIRSDGRRLVARLAAPCEADPQYRAHPAVLDAGLQALMALALAGGESVRGLPVGVAHVWLGDMPRGEMRLFAEATGDACFDICIADSEGKVCAVLTRLAVREVAREAVRETVPVTRAVREEARAVTTKDLTLVPRWTPTSLSYDAPSGHGAVLVVSRAEDTGLAEAIVRAHKGEHIYRLVLGDRDCVHSARLFEVPRGDADAIDNFAWLHRSIAFGRVYIVQTRELQESSEPLVALFRVTKSLSEADVLRRGAELRVVGFDGYEVDGTGGANPLASAAFGFVSALAKERGLDAAVLDLASGELRPRFRALTWIHGLLGLLITVLTLGIVRPSTRTRRRFDALARIVTRARVERDPQPIALRKGGVWTRSFMPGDDASRSDFELRPGGSYLVVGGAAGVGLEVAKHLASRCRARVALVGRSEPGGASIAAAIAAVHEAGGAAEYYQADAGDASQLRDVVKRIERAWGAVHGVVHAAGVHRDAEIVNLDESAFRAVLAPKVEGTLALWQAVATLPLDFFALFSSATAMSSPPGLVHYAAANAFQDALAHRLAGTTNTRIRSINWGYWGIAGGDRAGDALAARGIHALDRGTALAAFERFLGQSETQVAFLKSAVTEPALPEVIAHAAPEPSSLQAAPTAPVPTENPFDASLREVCQVLSRVLEVSAARLRAETTFEDLGVDSVAGTEVVSALSRTFGDLPATLLYEHRTVGELARYLAPKWPARPAAVTAPARVQAVTPAVVVLPPTPAPAPAAAPEPPAQPHTAQASDDIAIIGIAGRYPGADDMDALWTLLRDGRDAITEVPTDRWDARDHFSEGREARTSYSKWGGFLADPMCFDADFFRIIPKEAEMLDPQERQFLEVAWTALEDAGYTPQSLGASLQSRAVGVFVGVMNPLYEFIAGEAWGQGSYQGGRSSYWSIANRVSYTFDLRGPSLAVDTACSSSLVAVHLACESLRRGESRVAIAGGVNLILHPRHFYTYSTLRMFSPTGKCRPFAADADGMVIGEGAGAVILKPLRAALEDGDHVYAVIKGSATNANGRTNGYTIPSPVTQAEGMQTALRVAHVEPATISYVEAGMGTELGDPIEARGLAAVFHGRTEPLAVGSVKSNIGHLESAAGMAALSKVVLQMQHGQLVPSLHATPTNPRIDFEAASLRLQTSLEPWHARGARRAAISAFGAGGANAHVIFEEAPPRAPLPARSDRDVVLLSARDPEQLRAYAQRFLHFANAATQPRLVDVAFTTQTGRVALTHRLAILAGDLPELARGLERWLHDGSAPHVVSGIIAPDADSFPMDATADLETRAHAWARGAEWSHTDSRDRRRVSLPTYPFARTPFSIPRADVSGILGGRQGVARLALPEAPVVPEPAMADDPLASLGTVLLFDIDESTRDHIHEGTDGLVRVILVVPGDAFEQRDEDTFAMRPDSAEDNDLLLDALCAHDIVPDRILFLWARAAEGRAHREAPSTLAPRTARRLVTTLAREQMPRDVRFVYAYRASADALEDAHRTVESSVRALDAASRIVVRTFALPGAESIWHTSDTAEQLVGELSLAEEGDIEPSSPAPPAESARPARPSAAPPTQRPRRGNVEHVLQGETR